MKREKATRTEQRDRVTQMVTREFRKHLRVIAALDGTSLETAFDKYAAVAVAKVFEQKTQAVQQ